MKKRLLSALVVMMSALSSFAFETGEFVYTPIARYQITEATNMYNGGTDLTKWTAISATEGTGVGAIFAVESDEAGNPVFQSLVSTSTEGMSYPLNLTSGTYVLSMKIKGVAASAGIPLQTTHSDFSYTFLTDLDRLNYINIMQDDTLSLALVEQEVPGDWQTISFGFDAEGGKALKLILQGMNTGIQIGDIQIQKAQKVGDKRQKDFAIKYADATLAALGYSAENLPEDLSEIYPAFVELDEAMSEEEFNGYLDEFNTTMAEFRAANMDDQLTDADSHFPYYEGTSKKQKLNTYGAWTCYPVGRAHVDPAPGYVHMGHYAGYIEWGDPTGVDQTVSLTTGKYIFRTNLRGYFREEKKSSCWNNDDGLVAVEGLMYVLNEAGDTIASTGRYDLSPIVFTPNVLSFEIAENGNYTIAVRGIEKELYATCMRGGALDFVDFEFYGKTDAKYSKAQYMYEEDVLGQIAAGREAITTAQGYYADDSEYSWGKADLKAAVAEYESIIAGYEAMDEDAIIATYDADIYDSSKGLEVMNEDMEGTPYYRLLASEVYRTATKLLLDANSAFLAKNDTLNSLSEAIGKAEAALVNRVFDASSEKAQLEAEIATAKALLSSLKASEYNEENVAAILAENEALANAIVTFQEIPADKITSIVDIDFNQFLADGSNVPAPDENGGATIAGNKGEMVMSFWSNVTDGQPYEVGWDNNGAKDSVNVLRVGNGTGTVDFNIDGLAESTNIVRVSMDWWFGQLSGKYCGFYVQNAAEENVSGLYYSVYDAKAEYDPCGISSISGFCVSAKTGNAGHCVDANKTSVTLYLDYGTKLMQMETVTPSKTNTTDWVEFDGSAITKFILSGNYNNSDRRSWFDNLKIDLIQAGQPSGIETVTTNKFAGNAVYNLVGVRVDNNYKGIVIKNGKKFVK